MVQLLVCHKRRDEARMGETRERITQLFLRKSKWTTTKTDVIPSAGNRRPGAVLLSRIRTEAT